MQHHIGQLIKHELTYAGDELEALTRAAAARRKGQPLRRVLILRSSAAAAAPVVEVLVAEFAVQVLPRLYARWVAATAEPPEVTPSTRTWPVDG